MKKLVVLSAGNIASETVKRVRKQFSDLEIIVADIDKEKADQVAAEVNGTGVQFDATDSQSITQVIKDADLVFNAVGPFYRYGLPIIKTAIENKVNYIDVCDEHDVTVALVEDEALNQQAREAGIFAMFGMGFSPGVSNLAAKWASNLLEEIETIEIATAIPYLPNLGTTVNDHMLHSMSGKIPQFVDGKIQYFPAWGGEKRFVFEGYEPMMIGYMGHPEGVTLGHSIPGVKNATIHFRWLEDEGTNLWKTFVKLGLAEQVEEDNLPMAPRQFLARYMDTKTGMKHLSLSEDSDAVYNIFQINAYGKRDEQDMITTIEYHSENKFGDPTPIATSRAIAEALLGRIQATGLIAPEVGIETPDEFVKHVVGSVNGKIYMKEQVTKKVDL